MPALGNIDLAVHAPDPFLRYRLIRPRHENPVRGAAAHVTGAASIHDFYAALFRAFPDFWLDVQRKHSAAGAIVVEGDLGGTHRAEWQGIPATGKSVRIPFCAVFTFDANDSIQAEIVYFDRLSMLIQLGVMNQTA